MICTFKAGACREAYGLAIDNAVTLYQDITIEK